MPDDQKPTAVLDKTTLIPLGLLIAVILAAVGGTWQLGAAFKGFALQQAERDNEFALKFQRIEIQLEQLQRAVSTTDFLHRSDLREFATELKARNPTMSVPEVNR